MFPNPLLVCLLGFACFLGTVTNNILATGSDDETEQPVACASSHPQSVVQKTQVDLPDIGQLQTLEQVQNFLAETQRTRLDIDTTKTLLQPKNRELLDAISVLGRATLLTVQNPTAEEIAALSKVSCALKVQLFKNDAVNLEHLKPLKTLEELDLISCKKLKNLCGIEDTNLQKIVVVRSGMTDIAPLMQLPALVEADITHCPGVPQEKIDALKAHLAANQPAT